MKYQKNPNNSPDISELSQYINEGASYKNVRDTIHAIANFLSDINRPHWLIQALSEYRYSEEWSNLNEYVLPQLNKYPEPTSAPRIIWWESGKLVTTSYEEKLAPPARIATKNEYQSLLFKSDIVLHEGEFVQLAEGVFLLGNNLAPQQEYYPLPRMQRLAMR